MTEAVSATPAIEAEPKLEAEKWFAKLLRRRTVKHSKYISLHHA
jgi:hypothetical protein